MATGATYRKENTKLTDAQKAKLKFQKAFSGIAVTRTGIDVVAAKEFCRVAAETGRMLEQTGDMQGKRPQGCPTHEVGDIIATIADITTSGNLVRVE